MKKLMMLVLCLCVAGMAQADVVLGTDFDGATPNAATSDLDGVTWTTDAAVTASGTLTSVSGHELSNVAPTGATPSQWTDNVGVDYNLNTDIAVPRGIVASFSATGALGLGDLVIGHVHTSNAGSFQIFTSDMTVTLKNETDGIDVYTDTTNYDYQICYDTQVWLSHTYDLSGLSLEAGKDYTLTLTMQNMPGGGAYAAWNEVTLNTIPEPATMALLGLGGLLSLRRRK